MLHSTNQPADTFLAGVAVPDNIMVEPPCRSFPEVGFLICGAFEEWVRQSSVCGPVGYPFEHADSGKVAWPASFFCGKRPKTVGPASLIEDLSSGQMDEAKSTSG